MRAELRKLQIEMVPGDLWDRNLRSNVDGLGKARWDKLRYQLMAMHGTKCSVCGSKKKLHGHEVWKYKTVIGASIAKLVKVEIVCQNCHDIFHWGRTFALIKARIISKRRHIELRRHFCRVNNCSQEDFDKHVKVSRRKWIGHTLRKWEIDWGPFLSAVAEAKEARRIWHKRHKLRVSF